MQVSVWISNALPLMPPTILSASPIRSNRSLSQWSLLVSSSEGKFYHLTFDTAGSDTLDIGALEQQEEDQHRADFL